MFPVMNSAHKLNGIAFILMLGVMLIYSLPTVVTFGKTQSWADASDLFMSGQLLRQFEDYYDKGFFLRNPSIELWASGQYLLFREGSSGVVLGREGWLFSNEEYRLPNAYQQTLSSNVAKIAEVEKTLKAHNKRLILLPLPMKLDVYAEYATRAPDSRSLQLYGDFIAQLGHSRIEAAPLREVFLAQKDRQPLFLRTDTHWSPFGARLAAQELARQHPELIGSATYSSHRVAEKNLAGDLSNYLQFAPGLAPEHFKPSPLTVFETLKDNQEVSADSLFGEAEQPIMLVGSSYTKIDDWNFPGFLKESLKSDLQTTAVEARGPYFAMQQFLQGEQLKNPAITTVIWEFPLRTLLSEEPITSGWQVAVNQFF
jgi:alginate O-acetyltransferase complex protein AlgJ